MALGALALIALAAGAVYANSFSGTFVLDDHIRILENPLFQNIGANWPLLITRPVAAAAGRPVVNLTLALNYWLGKFDVRGYHAVNLAIHILAAWTLFGVMRRTLLLPRLRGRFGSAATPLALATALIWTVHPLQTQAVTYIIQRTESLVSLFYLLTLYCVIRGATANAGKPADAPAAPASPAWYVAAALACLLGMATKEVMATAPLVVLLYDRTFLAGSFRRAMAERWGLYLALASSWGIVAWLLIGTGFHGNTAGFGVSGFTWWSYLRTEPGVLAHYLRLALWPTGQSLDYGWPPADRPIAIVLPGLLIVGLIALTVWGLVKRPALGFLGACFFLILAPTSSFVPLNDAAFEYRMYLPLAAVVALVVLAAAALWRLAGDRAGTRQGTNGAAAWIGPAVLLCAVLAGLGWATARRNEVYRSEMAVWRDVIAKNPDHVRGLDNLAKCLINDGRPDEALPYLERALKLRPDDTNAWVNLGQAHFHRNDAAQAMAAWTEALKIEPDNADANNTVGYLLIGDGKYAEAIDHLRKALKANRFSANAHHNLGLALYRQGLELHSRQNLDEAIAEYRAALAIDPKHPQARSDLREALAEKAVRVGTPASPAPANAR